MERSENYSVEIRRFQPSAKRSEIPSPESPAKRVSGELPEVIDMARRRRNKRYRRGRLTVLLRFLSFLVICAAIADHITQQLPYVQAVRPWRHWPNTIVL